jgi:Putative transposase
MRRRGRSYSQDLRGRVLVAVDARMAPRQAAPLFRVSVSYIYNARHREDGDDPRKRPFAGPAAVLAYLSRYNHHVAIANSRLIALNDGGVSFRWKDTAPAAAV